MRNVWVLAVLIACGGGQSISPDECEHTVLDSLCCLTDQTCGGGRCEPPARRSVTAFCESDEECSEGEFCDLAIMRCDEQRCTTDGDCPIDFSCSSGMCFRRACETASDCSMYCIKNQCFQRAGECLPPAGF